MPYRILVHITRPLDDRDDRPMVCRLPLFRYMALGQFVLLHERKETGELERLNVGKLQGVPLDTEQSPSVHGSGCQMISPGQTDTSCIHLTANYQTQLVPGETYHLLWPGGEVEEWDWVLTNEDDEDWEQEFKPPAVQKAVMPRLVLPPAAGIVFTAVAADEAFPDRGRHIECDGPHASYDVANDMEYDWRLAQERLREAQARGPTPEPQGISANDRV